MKWDRVTRLFLPIGRHWIRLCRTLYCNGLTDAYAIVIELILAINPWCNTAYRLWKKVSTSMENSLNMESLPKSWHRVRLSWTQ